MNTFRRHLDAALAEAEWRMRYDAIAYPWVAFNAPANPFEVWAEVVDGLGGFS